VLSFYRPRFYFTAVPLFESRFMWNPKNWTFGQRLRCGHDTDVFINTQVAIIKGHHHTLIARSQTEFSSGITVYSAAGAAMKKAVLLQGRPFCLLLFYSS
jgi:hypothetical protein